MAPRSAFWSAKIAIEPYCCAYIEWRRIFSRRCIRLAICRHTRTTAPTSMRPAAIWIWRAFAPTHSSSVYCNRWRSNAGDADFGWPSFRYFHLRRRRHRRRRSHHSQRPPKFHNQHLPPSISLHCVRLSSAPNCTWRLCENSAQQWRTQWPYWWMCPNPNKHRTFPAGPTTNDSIRRTIRIWFAWVRSNRPQRSASASRRCLQRKWEKTKI